VGIITCSQNVVEWGKNKNFFSKGEDLIVRLAFNLLLFYLGKDFLLYRALRAAASNAAKIHLLKKFLEKPIIKGMTTIFDKNEKKKIKNSVNNLSKIC
jgi:hypothetical protein